MRAGTGIAAALCLAATAPAAAQSATDFTLPTYAGAYQPEGVDERGLWMLDDESERLLRDSRLVIDDAPLNAYVRNVLCRTVGQDRCAGVRIYIMRAPYFNASMSPNGTMRIWSGLLLRVRNEAELASVLGHEFAHFELRHSLADYRRARTGTDLLAWAAVASSIAATYGTGQSSSYRDPRISVYGTLAEYNRDQERAADVRGFAYMTQASYRPSAAAEVWRAQMNEADHAAAGRRQRSTRYQNVAFFASHPTDLERADYLSGLANRVSGGDFDGGDAHARAIAPMLPIWLDDQIKLNDFGGTEYLLARLASENWTAPLLHARGELYRTRGNPRDLVSAADFYRQALALEPAHALAMRGLGLSLVRAGAREEGRKALADYLAAAPDAPDAAMLRSIVEQ